MADVWDHSQFGLTPVAPAPDPSQAAPAPAQPAAQTGSSWDQSQFGLQPVQTPAQPLLPLVQQDQPRAIQMMRAAQLTPTETNALVAGKDRALQDMTDRPAQWLASLFGQGDAVKAQDDAQRQAYDQQYGNQPAAALGRGMGQAGLAIPTLGALGPLLGGAGDVTAAGASRLSPLLGNAAQFATDFAGGNVGGAGGILPRALQGASVLTNEGLKGAGAAGLMAGQSDAPLGDQMLQGAETGAGIGGAARAGGAVMNAAGSAISGSGIGQATADLARLARDKYGINLTADMISDSPFIRTLGSQASQIPLSGMADAKNALQGQFTRAVAGTFGEDADQITPAVMQAAKTRIGGVMNDVASRNAIQADPQLAQDFQQIARDSMTGMPDSERPLLQRQMEDILGMAGHNSGQLPGNAYQTLTNYTSGLSTSMRNGTQTMQDFSGRLKGALDSALERSAIANGNGADIQALQQARSQYKALKTVEPLVSKGEPGEITPNLLRGRVDQSYAGRNLRAQQPDLGELADIGQRFKMVPDSGTAGRGAMYAAMAALGGAGTSLAAGNPLNALLSASSIPAAMIGARAATGYLTSPTTINRLLSPPPAIPTTALSTLVGPGAALLQQNLSAPR